MAFVVDGAEWCFDGWPAGEIAEAIDQLLERVSTARDRNEIVWIGDDLQTRPVLDALDLWSLFSPTAPIHLQVEIQQELAAWLGIGSCYLDEEKWPDGMSDSLIQIDSGLPKENADVAWAHHNVRAGIAVACRGLKRSGPHTTLSSQGSATVHWIQNEVTHRAFWRAAIDVEGGSEATLERLAPHAFPDLHFHDGVWRGLNRFAGGYTAMRFQVQRYLAVLDEHGKWAFTYPPPALRRGEATGPRSEGQPPNQVVERRFHGLALTMAPENPDVYANGNCRRAREVTIGKRALYCEWHGKLEPHQNRVHIHPPVPESEGKVVIAIFHEHLPLP
jgi:hypothetical protein